MSKKFLQAVDDEFIEIDSEINIACCDCALVHRVTAEIRNGKVFLSFRRENRKTAALRRWHGIPMQKRNPTLFAADKGGAGSAPDVLPSK